MPPFRSPHLGQCQDLQLTCGFWWKKALLVSGKPELLVESWMLASILSYHQGNATVSVSKSGPLQAPGHDQKKAGACIIIRALIQAFFVGSEGGVEIGEVNPLRGSACPYCLRKTTDEDDNDVTVNV
jgi:hypothetical protein